MFRQTHPILGTRDMRRAIAFYTQKLGFRLAFGGGAEEPDAEHPNYVGYRRDGVELHMQFQYPHEMGTIRLRFLVEDPDAFRTSRGGRASSRSTTPTATRSPFTGT